jgi:hypothetical protein
MVTRCPGCRGGRAADDSEAWSAAEAAREAVRQYDWETVAADVVAVYETVAGQRWTRQTATRKVPAEQAAAARSVRQTQSERAGGGVSACRP